MSLSGNLLIQFRRMLTNFVFLNFFIFSRISRAIQWIRCIVFILIVWNMVFIQSMSIEHVLFSNGVGIFLNKNRHWPYKNIFMKKREFLFRWFQTRENHNHNIYIFSGQFTQSKTPNTSRYHDLPFIDHETNFPITVIKYLIPYIFRVKVAIWPTNT